MYMGHADHHMTLKVLRIVLFFLDCNTLTIDLVVWALSTKALFYFLLFILFTIDIESRKNAYAI